PGAEYEQQLPGERVEVPVAARIARHVPMELPGQHVERRRCGKRQARPSAQQPEYRGEQQQQDDVERQYVHVRRLELQQHRLNDGDIGLLEEVEDVHLLGVERVLEAGCDVGDLGQIDREQENVGDVDLPGTPQDARTRDEKSAILHFPAVDK